MANSDMLVQFAEKNLGIACVVADFAQEYLDNGEVFQLEFDKKIPKRRRRRTLYNSSWRRYNKVGKKRAWYSK